MLMLLVFIVGSSLFLMGVCLFSPKKSIGMFTLNSFKIKQSIVLQFCFSKIFAIDIKCTLNWNVLLPRFERVNFFF